MAEKLRTRGFGEVELTPVSPPEKGTSIYIEQHAVFGPLFGRAVAKIAFNYMASQFGPKFARMAQFNAIRSYIREGIMPPWKPWTAENGPGADERPHRMKHLLTVARNARETVGTVSFHSFSVYRVKLEVGGFLVQATRSSAHVFDLEEMRAMPLRLGR